MMTCTVVVGAGQAGYQTVASLRKDGHPGRLVLLGDEPGLPYQRPPLSKAYLAEADRERVLLRPEHFYREQSIELMPGERALDIQRQDRTLVLASGKQISYDHLVLAVGARPRTLQVPGADLDGVVALRSLHDADQLRGRLESATRVVVVGAGFIGMEFAAVASSRGADVTVVEAQHAVMPRAVSKVTADFFADQHAQRGVRILYGSVATSIVGSHGRVSGVITSAGDQIDADLVLVGIGVVPNTDLAQRAGLDVDNGIVVDDHLRTSDPAISAIGDCANYPSSFTSGMVRLESVQNAVDHARCVAARLTGRPHPYDSVPWFWSEQYGIKLQIAGITAGHDTTVVRGDLADNIFSVLCFRDGRLLGAESVNRLADHLAVRRLLTRDPEITPEQAADPSYDLKNAAGSGRQLNAA